MSKHESVAWVWMVVSSTLVPLWLARRLLLPSSQDTSNNVMVDISTSPRPSPSPFSVVWALWNVKYQGCQAFTSWPWLHQRKVRQQSQQRYQRTQHSRLISNQLGPDRMSTWLLVFSILETNCFEIRFFLKKTGHPLLEMSGSASDC